MRHDLPRHGAGTLLPPRRPHPSSSRDVTLQALDQFILGRSKEVAKSTLNKDIKNILAFLSWAAENRYIAEGLKITPVRVAQKPVVALSPT